MQNYRNICTISKTFLRLKMIKTKPLQLTLGSIKKIFLGKSKALFSEEHHIHLQVVFG